MDTAVIDRYAKLKLEEKRIKAELEELNPLVLEELKENNLPDYETPLGKFSVKVVKKYKYSPEVLQMKDILDAHKEQEEATGKATYTEAFSLVFTGNKTD